MLVLYVICLGVAIAAGVFVPKVSMWQRWLVGLVVFVLLSFLCTFFISRIEDMPLGESRTISVDEL
jgi:hypothetical protein